MSQEPSKYDVLWIASEICYYLGLVLATLFIPTLALILWMMSFVDKADPKLVYLDRVGDVGIVVSSRCGA